MWPTQLHSRSTPKTRCRQSRRLQSLRLQSRLQSLLQNRRRSLQSLLQSLLQSRRPSLRTHHPVLPILLPNAGYPAGG